MTTMHAITRSVKIQAGTVRLEGDLTVPEQVRGVVLFAHGSGSSRFSPRNRAVAERLHEASIATLLFDLLTDEEERRDRTTAELRFNIELLAQRLNDATTWLRSDSSVQGLKFGYFGASTGAAAAIIAAVQRDDIAAIVSRGGRPDLAMEALPELRSPALLIVGGEDGPVITMNRTAARAMRCEVRIDIVPGATHLFEEPGALEEVARLAANWFEQHF